MFGDKNEVDPVRFLIGAAAGWGGRRLLVYHRIQLQGLLRGTKECNLGEQLDREKGIRRKCNNSPSYSKNAFLFRWAEWL
jgi:hypothetical protein